MHTYIHTYRQTHTYIHTYIHTHTHTYIHTNIQTGRQAYIHTDRQTDRQTGRQSLTYIHTSYIAGGILESKRYHNIITIESDSGHVSNALKIECPLGIICVPPLT